MSILIEGMKMPKNCDDCPMLFEYRFCLLTDDHASSIEWKTEEKRMPNCPLIELPTIDPVKHGEWIITEEGEPMCSECGKVTQDMQDEIFELEEDLTKDDGTVLATKGTRGFALKYPNYCSRCGARMDGE